jgi:hypothetical protein
MPRTASLVVLGFVLAGASAAFEKADLGKAPRGWKVEAGAWQVRADATAPSKGGLVLTQTASSGRRVFNLCLKDEPAPADVEVSVAFKALEGKEDQGGGVVWRARDAKNYYIARMNPLEDNFRLYKVVAGVRKQLDTKEGLKVKPGEWHTITVRMVGDRVECSLDGKKMLAAKDDTFKEKGKVGLWTKADARTSFDVLRVKAAR